jgi:hypothetical protein
MIAVIFSQFELIKKIHFKLEFVNKLNNKSVSFAVLISQSSKKVSIRIKIKFAMLKRRFNGN